MAPDTAGILTAAAAKKTAHVRTSGDTERKEGEDDAPVAAAQLGQEALDTGAIILTASPAGLSELEHLCLLRIFRTDRVSAGVTPLVTQVLCDKYGPTILPSA